jgi:peptidoglycan-associated lipoprotein
MKTIAKVLTAAALFCVIFSAGCAGRGGRAGGSGDDLAGAGADGSLYSGELGERPEGTGDIILDTSFETVLFAYDRAQIDPSERAKIEKVAEFMKSNSGVGVIVEGHCDERGSREYNMALGERRALAVRAYLIGLGIAGENIQTVSFGKEKPALAGHDPESWRANRRAEFIFFRK